MDIDRDRGGLPPEFIGHLRGLMGYDHHGYMRQLATRGLEALRANGQFYQWYGGAYDILQAAAVFRSFGGTADRKARVAREAMLLAGWPLPRIETLELMVRALDDRAARCCFRGHEAEGKPFTGGLFVLRDVEVVPLVLPETRGEWQCEFADIRETGKGDGGLELHKVFMSMYRNYYECGSGYLGWSCAYRAVLDGLGDQKALVTEARREAIKKQLCEDSYPDDGGMEQAALEAARRSLEVPAGMDADVSGRLREAVFGEA